MKRQKFAPRVYSCIECAAPVKKGVCLHKSHCMRPEAVRQRAAGPRPKQLGPGQKRKKAAHEAMQQIKMMQLIGKPKPAAFAVNQILRGAR